ncbi:LysM peptidoglycan-binding domain-containing protein [Ohtaekwangia kribbensis]|jgi:membrane-bound lytic murein transglycosylase D|uniref:LysM peptidoglycan-binding domain-containing protein n=1 Tax=Ohtaekwangia kribbensis TaxID=688913 RepID=A0ABW3K436_9BACT
MRKKILLAAFITFSTLTYGQIVQQPDSVVVDSLEVAEAEEEMLYKEDTVDFVYFALPTELEYVPGDDDPAVIQDRLACISKRIPLVYNDRIHAFINYFTVRDREYTKMIMRRKNLYFPIFEKYLAKYNLPDELKYLSIIESGLNPRAISRVRAVGLWQFMSATGKYYGLHNDWFIDERMDPEKSTESACRYLRDLYNMFHDWELALAAYNTGPGNVKRAIRKSGYKRTFWEIYPNLPRETRSYVPQFVAITYTMNYLDEHNFYNEGEEKLVTSDTLHVNKYLHFETFANLTNACIEDLQRLNPSIQHNALPETHKPYVLYVPKASKDLLALNRYAILDSASKVGRNELLALAKKTEGSTYGRDRIVYKVRSGDVLGSIAIRHGVSVTNLKKWNNMRSNTIRVGQRLNIWLKGSPRSTTMVASAKQTNTTPTAIPDSKTYTVQPGDTLWHISRKFEGLTVDKIKSMNNLGDNKLQPGQKLIIGI